ncbi:hypothetical protein HRH59_08445 [Rheinheimera sp. YQF-2]|uniref:XRE family transcriptional regulator n=1 Tax=Rheinheimera lutimaris TaxID=2740584 RepID=A0A7Y5AQD7_9GAMM|nr:hypothetical protein [Rheinheimera lutimaris]NRQ42603.1 hypothetical protein [Rheinheimera lutimaris]
MNYSFELIEIYMSKMGIASFSALSREIPKLSQPNISEIKKAERHLTPEQGMFIAEKCGLDIGEVLVKLDIDRASTPKLKEEFTKVLKRLAGAVACISLIVGLMTTPASDDSSLAAS